MEVKNKRTLNLLGKKHSKFINEIPRQDKNKTVTPIVAVWKQTSVGTWDVKRTKISQAITSNIICTLCYDYLCNCHLL